MSLALLGAGPGGSGAAFTPASLSGLVGWWKADAISALNDNDPVTTWTDSSAAAHDLSTVTASFKPLYKTAILNGLPVVRFDGSNDRLTTASFTLNQPATYFAVVQYRVAWSANTPIIDGLSAQFSQYLFRSSSTVMGLYAGTNGPTVTTTPQAAHVYSAVFNGASSLLRVDGGTDSTGNPSTGNAGGLTVGATSNGVADFAAIDVGELLAYTGALSSSDRALVETYLKAKWATP